MDSYGGMLPSWNPRLIPPGQAAYCRDCWLSSGTLIGWRQPKLLRTLTNPLAKFAYRIPSIVTNDTRITAPDSYWMEFLDADTNVVRSPVVDDSFHRYYTASPSQVPRYNTYDRITSNQHDWILGVPASGCAPGVTVAGGGDAIQLGFNTITTGGGIDYRPGNSIFLLPIIPGGSLTIQDVA